MVVKVPLTEHGSLKVAIVVETEQGMAAGAAEVAVVRRSFLSPAGLTHRAIHIQNDPRELSCLPDAVDPFP